MFFNPFKKKSVDKTPSNRYTTYKVKEIVRETVDAVTIVFEKPSEGIEYKSGQYLTLIFTIDGEEIRRSYSLCSSPLCDEYPAITVKKITDGRLSSYINDKLEPGAEIKVMPPMGNFTIEPKAENARLCVFFGAGSGITPLMSIMKSVLKGEPGSKALLIYANRNQQQIIFNKALVTMKSEYANRFSVIHVLSQPEGNWQGLSGRLTTATINEIFADYTQDVLQSAEFFLCGPAGMMQLILETLNGMSVDPLRIHKESFVSSIEKAIPAESTKKPEPDHEVTLIMDGESYKVKVPAKKSILKSGLDAGIDLPFSCQSGVCTSCRGKLISGKIRMEEDEGLSQAEKDEGYVLCCVGHPLTDDVRIEIG